jgi:hypothetical protein
LLMGMGEAEPVAIGSPVRLLPVGQ